MLIPFKCNCGASIFPHKTLEFPPTCHMHKNYCRANKVRAHRTRIFYEHSSFEKFVYAKLELTFSLDDTYWRKETTKFSFPSLLSVKQTQSWVHIEYRFGLERVYEQVYHMKWNDHDSTFSCTRAKDEIILIINEHSYSQSKYYFPLRKIPS